MKYLHSGKSCLKRRPQTQRLGQYSSNVWSQILQQKFSENRKPLQAMWIVSDVILEVGTAAGQSEASALFCSEFVTFATENCVVWDEPGEIDFEKGPCSERAAAGRPPAEKSLILPIRKHNEDHRMGLLSRSIFCVETLEPVS
jgi:hypothetical protein